MTPKHNRERGSLLIVAMLFCAVIALVLTSYLTVANQAMKLSQRSFAANNAMNLAESGIEMAMAGINTKSWTGWTISGADASQTFSGFDYGNGITGSVKVHVRNYLTLDPTVIAKATITNGSGGPPVEKMVAVSGFIQRSLFSKGLVGKNGLTFNGNNPSVDSWDSLMNPDGTLRASPVGYSPAVDRDAGSIAAVNVTATASVNNADIWGTASVGSSSTAAIDVGPQGRVGPYGTLNGDKNEDYISTNFTTNFPAIDVPDPAAADTNDLGGNIVADLTLPRTGDRSVTDETGKVTYYYKFPQMTGGVLRIDANKNVVLLPTAGPGTNAIQLAGNGSDAIEVEAGAKLDIYTDANISMSGQAYIANVNGTAYSSSIQIWGTNTSSSSPGQSIDITGNGVLMCTCYAPNAAISAKGGGNSGAIYGAFVGYTITMTGNDAFHYDEALGRLGTSGTFMPTKWIELIKASDRAVYDAHF